MADPKTQKRALREQAIALVLRTQANIKKLSFQGVIEIKTPDAFVLSMFWRSIGLFEGIVVLLQKGLGEEALILGRSLFVEALRLAEIEQAGDKRIALILGWINSSLEEKKGLMREAKRLGLDSDPSLTLDKFEEEQKKLQRYASRHSVGRLRKFLRAFDAAAKFGRKDDYWTYALAHEMVHGSDAAFIFRRRRIAADTVAIHNQTTQPEIICGIACFAATSIVQAATATFNIFGWNQTEKLAQLLEKIQELQKRLQAGQR